jgi:hypothetical protein
VSEQEIRDLCEAYDALVQGAVTLVREHGDAISTDEHRLASDFDPRDEAAVRLTIEGDAATLYYTADGHDGDYASRFEFWARALWEPGALREMTEALKAREAALRARYEAEARERERREWERLRAKFGDADPNK